MPGFTVGCCSRSPHSIGQDRSRQRRGGLSPRPGMLDRFFNEMLRRWRPTTPTALEEWASCRSKLDHRTPGIEVSRAGMDALRCPPGDADVTKLWAVSAVASRLQTPPQAPDLLLLDEPPTTRPESSSGWSVPGEVRRTSSRSPRPLLPRQRGRWILELDRAAATVRRQLPTYLEKKASG